MNKTLEEQTRQEAATIIEIMAKLQASINATEELGLLRIFAREIKKRTNSYILFLEKELERVYKKMSKDEKDEFVRIVSEIDKIKINVDIDIKE